MSQQGVVKRYSLILEKIKQSHYPNLQTLIDFLARNDLDISERTIQRDLEQLRQAFELNILYCRINRGYYIPEKDRLELGSFLKFLEIVDTTEVISESLAESRDTLTFISFDAVENSRGAKFLKPVLKALRERNILKMEYMPYSQGEKKTVEILPYLLKHYMGRWYLVACYKGGKSKLYLFGLDRILSLSIVAKKFKPDPQIDAKERFKQIIGISDTGEPQKRVVLSFKPEKAPYVKSLPLHSSQRILFETDKECRIEISVKINNELISKILSFGPQIKVIEPALLATQIKTLLAESLNQYGV